jgi:hypothetical protein
MSKSPRYEVIKEIPDVGDVLKDNAGRGGDKYLFVPEGGGLFPIDYLWEIFGHKPEVREVRQSLGV